MHTYTQILYQIVFSTKYRRPVLLKENRPALFKYMWGILEHKRCRLYRINGVEDHLHIVTHLHPSVALADLVKDVKVASSEFIKAQNLFPDFHNWQVGYSAFTYTQEAKHNLIKYVKNQEEHHKKQTSRDELIALLREHQIEFDELYLDE
jgi:putative transposase